MKLDGKTAIITGAGFGIGKGIAQAFAKEGANLVLAARNGQRLHAVADELRSQGATVISVPTDVTHEQEVIALFEITKKQFGRLDILVNNASLAMDPTPLEQTSLEKWQKIIDANLTGPFLCTREALKIMKPQGEGRIINMGSIAAKRPRPQAAAYSCSKMGVIALTTTTALEGRDYGIVVSCIHSGNVNTAQSSKELAAGEPWMEIDDIVKVVMTVATFPLSINMVETIVVPTTQLYLGRG